jgi:hypothetical protein
MDGFAALRLTALQPGEEHLADLTALRLDPEVALFLGGVIAACLDSNHRHRPRAQRLLRTLRARDGPFAGRVGLRRAWIESVLELEGDLAPAKRIGGRVWRQRSLKPPWGSATRDDQSRVTSVWSSGRARGRS